MAPILNSSEVIFAIITGLVPSLIWLYFWQRLDRKHPEPFGLLLLCFMLGAGSVLLATMLEQTAQHFFAAGETQIAVFAGIEEVLKFLVFYLVAYKSPFDDEAIDPAIYLITVALGFAALENIFYVLKPGLSFNITAAVLTGGLRFFGSTLLHTIASSCTGIAIVLFPRSVRGFAITIGLALAIFLHASFNFFILKNDTASFIQIYGYLWVAAIIGHVILEKLRRLPAGRPIALT